MESLQAIRSVFSKDSCSQYYTLSRTLGQGSFATVKLAVCKADKTKWAVKVIEKKSLNPEDEKALKTEVDILGCLNHPNIVQLKETFNSSACFYMVMELCTGGELFDKIVTKEHYSEREAHDCIRTIAETLAYLHDKDIAHRDIKPENLLYSDYDESKAVLKLADFGLAQLLTNNVLMKTACGTPGYVAPEILEGKPYGKEVDIWALGVISYILLCGFPPFYDENSAELFRCIKAGNYDYPSPFWDGVSSGARDLIDHMLVLNPKTRFTAKDVLSHSWIADNSTMSDAHLPHFQTSMKAYNARRKFRAVVHMVGMLGKSTKLSSKKMEDGDEERASAHMGETASTSGEGAQSIPETDDLHREGTVSEVGTAPAIDQNL